METNSEKMKLENSVKLSSLNPSDALEFLKASPEGLSAEEAIDREKKYGKNKLHKERNFHPIKQLLKQFTHFMAILLWVAGILAFIAGMPQLAVATWAVIVINALFSFLQEFKADKALSELSDMIPSYVKVYRNGELTTLPAEDITIGDTIVLEAGDSVPADARLIKTHSLFLNNSMLTGESVPLNRTEEEFDAEGKPVSEINNFVFAGTTVTQGKGTAVVYAIGNDTQIGQVSTLTQTIVKGDSTLEVQVEKIVKFITKVAIILGAAAFLAAVLVTGMSWKVGFIFAIGILVANVPEGLLPTVSLCLAVGVQRMAKEKALVRKLSAVETLSAASVICTDKTGTLTQNQLMVRKIWTPDGEAEVSGSGYKKDGEVILKERKARKSLEMLFSSAIICSEANIKDSKKNQDEWEVIGSPTEASILIAAEKYGISVNEKYENFNRIEVKPFTSERKMMSVLAENKSDVNFKENEKVIFTKGAPNIVLECCKYYYKDGIVTPLTSENKKQILAKNDAFAEEGFRVLGICYEYAGDHEAAGKDMVFIGLTAMYDPPRPEVAAAVRDCHHAGIKITVITGDYGITAAAIGKQIGLIKDKYQIVTGSEVEAMSQKELMDIVKQDIPLVFSRTTPQHKLKIVEAYKKLGEIVAVTGDGVNDILALKASNIGIAMGKNGTDVAREVADMILLDDNFATIVKAIEEGRSVYSNIRKFLTYILASNVPEIIPFIAMVLFHIPPALTVLQILAIDLGTDMFPALALGAEKPEKGVLDLPPRKPEENLLDKKLFIRAYGFLGLIEGILAIVIFMFAWSKSGYSLPKLQSVTDMIVAGTASAHLTNIYVHSTTMTLMAVIACQMGNLFVCRSERLPFWSLSSNRNNLIYFGLAFEALLSLMIIFVPGFQSVFQTSALNLSDYSVLALCPIALIILEESRKFIFREAAENSYQKLREGKQHA
ncbi:MAG: cation-transporting P-type ATPase [Bacillota bacterium]|nr:cation-transporting P-type ATPase [Bacillota bacterium]